MRIRTAYEDSNIGQQALQMEDEEVDVAYFDSSPHWGLRIEMKWVCKLNSTARLRLGMQGKTLAELFARERLCAINEAPTRRKCKSVQLTLISPVNFHRSYFTFVH